MFQIDKGEKIHGTSAYEDTVYRFIVHTDLNRNQVEEEIKKALKERHMPTRNYGEWKTATRANGAMYYCGYYTITALCDKYIVETVQPTAE